MGLSQVSRRPLAECLTEAKCAFTLNRYRVLLTEHERALSSGAQGDLNDLTRDPARCDRVYDALRRAGVPELYSDYADGWTT